MSFRDCIFSARDQGALSAEEADDLIRRYEAHVGANKATDHPGGPEGAAKDALAKEIDDAALRKERLAELAAAKADEIAGFLEEYRDASGRPDVLRAAKALLENRNDELAGAPSVVGRRDALTGWAHGALERNLYDFRRTWGLGKRMNRARLDRVVDEAFGAGTGDVAARGFLDAWRGVADDLVDRFNAAGGEVGKMANYFPQAHDARQIVAGGEAAWIAFIKPRLDLERMRDPLSGAALSPERLAESLSVVWRRIVTDGAIDLSPSGQPQGRGALANQRQEERFLHFKDAAAWRDYAEAYGNPDVYAVMMHHIHGLTKDVAALEILGPNPGATVEWLKQVVSNEAAKARVGKDSLYRGSLTPTVTGRISDGSEALDRLWSVVNGSVGTGNLAAADVMESLRNVTTAANLGGTFVTALFGDPAQQAWASHFAGIPALRYFATLPRQLFATASKREVARAGVIFEDALDHLATDFRALSWSARSKEATRWLPDRVFSWSGLTPWDRAERRTHAFNFMFKTADHASSTLAEMTAAGGDAARRARWLQGFGIGEAEWNMIRAAAADRGEAGSILRVVDVIAAHPGDEAAFEAAMRYSEALHAFVEEAVPHGTARARTGLGAAIKKGTVAGELIRQPTSYLTYPASMLLSLIRATSLEASGGNYMRGAGFLAAAVIGLTIGGAFVKQARALRSGADPEPVDTPSFWAGALAQGGALGFFGDWLLADYSRGPADTAARFAGPVGGLLADVASIANVRGFSGAPGSEINRGARAVQLAKRLVPGQSMWWVRPVTERLIWDRLQRLADPHADRAFQSRANKIYRERGQGMWWPRGTDAPTRPPDLSHLF